MEPWLKRMTFDTIYVPCLLQSKQIMVVIAVYIIHVSLRGLFLHY